MPLQRVHFLNGSENPANPATAQLQLVTGGGPAAAPPVPANPGQVQSAGCAINNTVTITTASEITIPGHKPLHLKNDVHSNTEFREAIVAFETDAGIPGQLHGRLWAVNDNGDVQSEEFA